MSEVSLPDRPENGYRQPRGNHRDAVRFQRCGAVGFALATEMAAERYAMIVDNSLRAATLPDVSDNSYRETRKVCDTNMFRRIVHCYRVRNGDLLDIVCAGCGTRWG